MKNKSAYLWILTIIAFFAVLTARIVLPEITWLTAVTCALLVATLAALVFQNRRALRTRTAAYGINAAVTVILVIAIVGVLNFLASRYPQKLDLTKNKIHTLSDQTVKVVKGLKQPVKAVLFSKIDQREQFRPLLENYKALSPKFELEYVNPDKEPMRAKTLGIRKYNTLYLSLGTHDTKVEDPNEEKITNGLIKISKDKNQTLCFITGHGEKSMTATDAEGFDFFRRELVAQSYDVKEVSLQQEGKIPDNCDALAIMGPNKGFFDPEVKMIRDYLANGGHALIALSFNIKGQEPSPEILSILADWNIRSPNALIIDPTFRMAGVDASMPIVFSYSRDYAVTKDFFGQCFFPMSRPIEIVPGAPATLNMTWLAQTTSNSWAETDLKMLAKGEAKPIPGTTPMGPLNVAVAAEGKLKDSKASRNTRLVVFGSEYAADNAFSRKGANLDFYMNAASWVLGNDELISIRTKEEGPGRVELSARQQQLILLITVIALPILIALAGIGIWIYRRRL